MEGHATDTLRFIRATMERSATFSAVPGVGGMLMGAVGLGAMAVGSRQTTPDAWLATWLGAAVVAAAVGFSAIVRKARRAGLPLDGATTRRFAAGMAAPLAAGAALTYALWASRAYGVMPAAWLLLYGAAAITGGMFSVPAVRATGAAFMTLGAAAAVTPPDWGNLWLGAGFGVAHIGFGFFIARHHGG